MSYQKFLYLGTGKIVGNYLNSVWQHCVEDPGNIFNTEKAPGILQLPINE